MSSETPVLATLTPRTKRRQNIALMAKEKMEQNRQRQLAAEARRNSQRMSNRLFKPTVGATVDENDSPNSENWRKARNPLEGKGESTPPKPHRRRSGRGSNRKSKQDHGSSTHPKTNNNTSTKTNNNTSTTTTNNSKSNSTRTNHTRSNARNNQAAVSKKQQQQLDDAQEQIEQLNTSYGNLEAEYQELKDKHDDTQTEFEELKDKHDVVQTELGHLSDDRDALQVNYDKLFNDKQEMEESQTIERREAKKRTAKFEHEIKLLKALVDEHSAKIDQLNQANDQLTNTCASQTELIQQLEQQALEEKKIRRDLHNTIQELKGNIRVFARIRPLLGEDESSQGSQIEAPPNDVESRSLVVRGSEVDSVDGRSKVTKHYDFTFDKTFRPWQTQQDVFTEVAHLVQSACDGYRVSIMAYGQTGSGKTYTMEGSGWNGDQHAGIIPRAVEHVFQFMDKGKQQGWEFQVTATFLEIYNEEIRDLLMDWKATNGDDAVVNDLNSSTSKPQNAKMYDIRHTANGETTVQGLTQVRVDKSSDVQTIMKTASKLRSVAATQCNDKSSRSHSVFQLAIKAVHPSRGEERNGLLNLVDLAGSERLKSSEASGAQLKETQAINKSLSCLGDVIFALSNRTKHVPYRNSKLTYLLQNSLGGNSKTLMFVNISPTPGSANETLCTLRFGQKVNSCEIGTARRSVQVKK